MNIHGLQKLTLLDYPGKTACTVFLAACDFRCPFCHNSQLLDAGAAELVMDDEELLRFLKKREGMLDGVAFTGGEPLLSPELPALLRRIRTMDYAIKLDTNGNQPQRLRALIDEGLVDYVAMDVKNALPRYGETVGVAGFDTANIEQSIRLLLEDRVDYEFRTTVVRELHDESSFRGIAELIKGAKRYYLQCFTDRDSVPFAGLHAPEEADLRRYAEIVRPYVESVELRGV